MTPNKILPLLAASLLTTACEKSPASNENSITEKASLNQQSESQLRKNHADLAQEIIDKGNRTNTVENTNLGKTAEELQEQKVIDIKNKINNTL